MEMARASTGLGESSSTRDSGGLEKTVIGTEIRFRDFLRFMVPVYGDYCLLKEFKDRGNVLLTIALKYAVFPLAPLAAYGFYETFSQLVDNCIP